MEKESEVPKIFTFLKICKRVLGNRGLLAAGLLSLAAWSAFSPKADAAGFALFEGGTPAGSMAFAGAVAGGGGDGSASYSFWNPATLALHGEGLRSEIYQAIIIPEAKISVEGVQEYDGTLSATNPPSTIFNPGVKRSKGKSSSADQKAFVPALYAAYAPRDGMLRDAVFGLSVTVPFGLSTKYDGDWGGKMLGVKSKVAAVNISPMVAYRLGDNFSFGLGVQLQRLEGEFTSAPKVIAADKANNGYGYSKAEGDDWGYGYTVGMLFQPLESTRLGVSYRSKVKHKLEGNMSTDIPGGVKRGDIPGTHPVEGAKLTALLGTQSVLRGMNGKPIEANVELPDYIIFGGWHRLNDRLGIGIQATRMRWSTIKELAIKRKRAQTVGTTTLKAGSEVSKEVFNWKDTWLFSLGGAYELSDETTLRGGWAYDQTPVRDESRSVRVPDSDRQWFSVGVGHRPAANMTFDFHYTYLHFKKARINRTLKSAKMDVADRKTIAATALAMTGSQGLQASVDTSAHIISGQFAFIW